MTSAPDGPTGNTQGTGELPKKSWFRRLNFWKLLSFAAVLVVIIYNLGELVRDLNIEQAIEKPSMFSVPKEITDRYSSCDYRFLIICEPQSKSEPSCDQLTPLQRADCIFANNAQPALALSSAAGGGWVPYIDWTSIPYANLLITAVVTLPRLPDAIVHMLVERWRQGSLEFSLGLVFVLAYFTLVIVTLRSKSSASLLIFAAAVVFGPYVVGGIFWLLQQAFAGAAYTVTELASFLITTIGLPACLVICIKHDVGTLAKIVGAAP
ncbi:MAG TPA: hypothetical protein VGJ31_12220 [Dongiaceae bacterium]|jgi:hypothetical protein